ncbi:MAG TPA: flagellar motor protein [Candidatus Latescibacteria bacterium]|nr:flagellar motor protein [Candidatus Latescibacterota bacterium]
MKPMQGDDREDWQLSYGDMVTLLLTFFVVVVAMSQVNLGVLEEIGASMRQAIRGGELRPRYSLSELVEDVKRMIEEEELQGQVDVGITPQGIAINLKGAVLFDLGSAELKPQAFPLLTKLAGKLKALPYRVSVEGHTDDLPIHTQRFPSNWELSAARAASVVRFFIQQGIPKERLQAVGLADTQPRAPNTSPEDRAKNRRVVIQLLTL